MSGAIKSLTNLKVGIIGGGQLGKMLALEAGSLHIPVFALDKSVDFPAGPYVFQFTEGNFNNYDDVYQFGKDKDVVTIEIEHVNTDALIQLKKEGVCVHPDPESLNIIKDKGKQKQFYKDNGFPTSDFQLFSSVSDIKRAVKKGEISFPFVQKLCTDGYDGKGVKIILKQSDLNHLLEGRSLVEDLVDIQKELALIVARNERGETRSFTAVEMTFDPRANLVEYLLCPARIDKKIEAEAEKLAEELISSFNICGLLAIEFFLTKDQKLLINEVAPRPHNSGHHTLDSCFTSQFGQHLRAILNLPLGSTKIKSPAVMLNLLGKKNCSGPAVYQGLEECLAMEGVNIHLYGKLQTRPFRKMGHVTVLDDNLENALKKAKSVKNILSIIT